MKSFELTTKNVLILVSTLAAVGFLTIELINYIPAAQEQRQYEEAQADYQQRQEQTNRREQREAKFHRAEEAARQAQDRIENFIHNN